MKTYQNHTNPFLFVLLVLITLLSSCQKEAAIVPQDGSADKSARAGIIIPPIQVGYISSISLGSGKTINFYYRSGSKVPNMAVISDALKAPSRGITTTRWGFAYDSNLHLTTVTGDDGTVINVSTSTDGKITGASCSLNGFFQFSQSFFYDASNRIDHFQYNIAGANNQYAFTYLSNGNLNTVTRTGSPVYGNFTIQATGYDSQLSPWVTAKSNIAFWWMETVAYDLARTPGQWLSYSNNVTTYTFTDLTGLASNVSVSYSYDSGWGYAAQLLATNTNSAYYPGPYAFTYFYQ
ncbi:hypothetical protein QNI16_18870 [Cytophagaceae bacterium YF14B1]|uniref:DUF4595 domain-containing protein n=1 Tax=Xanthocytophaga flava TaxID=3048013 RepID=A0AAE3QTJ5_9BACT|nr:hypothetical protein [Xanthocytophaga flavus]MDJ1482574.1 hypothetical protein [Xanthocytophaga flavus]